MTETDFTKFKDELNKIRTTSANGTLTTHIEVAFHLTNGDVMKVGTSTIEPSDVETQRVEWETSSPTLTNGIVYAYDYPKESVDNPNFKTNVTYGSKKSYAFPLEAILYYEIDWTLRKAVKVENGSTANVAAD